MRQLAVTQLRSFLAEHPSAVLLDVREPWEVALASIRVDGIEALDIPMNQVPERLSEVPTTRPVICICHHGARSAQVVAFLAQHGIDAGYNLAGGIDAWSTTVDGAVPRY